MLKKEGDPFCLKGNYFQKSQKYFQIYEQVLINIIQKLVRNLQKPITLLLSSF